MAEKITLTATSRTDKATAVRRQGLVPAELYGHGVKNLSLQVEGQAFRKALEAAGYTSLVDLTVDNKGYNVLIRDVQFHPVNSNLLHIDFYQVRMDEEVRAEVPLDFIGESPAVKDLNGIFVRNIDEIEIEALPKDLPHNIPVDISGITDFDTAIHVKDIILPEGVTVLSDPEEVVALVQPPRSEEEIEALSEEVSEDVASVEGVEKKEEEPTEGEAAEDSGEEAKS